jgi:hypothetical protein
MLQGKVAFLAVLDSYTSDLAVGGQDDLVHVFSLAAAVRGQGIGCFFRRELLVCGRIVRAHSRRRRCTRGPGTGHSCRPWPSAPTARCWSRRWVECPPALIPQGWDGLVMLWRVGGQRMEGKPSESPLFAFRCGLMGVDAVAVAGRAVVVAGRSGGGGRVLVCRLPAPPGGEGL